MKRVTYTLNDESIATLELIKLKLERRAGVRVPTSSIIRRAIEELYKKIREEEE